MEIILTRNQLGSIYKNIEIQNIKVYHFIQECYLISKECDKVTFRDDNGTETILKNRQ